MQNDIQCVLNRADDALWHAKVAHMLLQTLDPSSYRQAREQIDNLLVNAIRSEAVAYHNLKLIRKANDCCDEAERTLAFKRNSSFWTPHLYRDKISALADKPRFSITDAVVLADQVQDVCEGDTFSSEENELLTILAKHHLARAYLQHGNLRKAEVILQSELERAMKLTYIGPLHRTLLLRTYARLSWRKGDLSGWKHFISNALELALSAGLSHQLIEMQKEYQDALAPIVQGLSQSQGST